MGEDEFESSRATAHSGLRRLMLKLPARRHQLAGLSTACPEPLLDLFQAYDVACLALEAFRRDFNRHHLVEEYETVCGEMEQEISQELERRRAD